MYRSSRDVAFCQNYLTTCFCVYLLIQDFPLLLIPSSNSSCFYLKYVCQLTMVASTGAASSVAISRSPWHIKSLNVSCAVCVQTWYWRSGECMHFSLTHLYYWHPSTASSCRYTRLLETADLQLHSKIQPRRHSVWSCTSFGQMVISVPRSCIVLFCLVFG